MRPQVPVNTPRWWSVSPALSARLCQGYTFPSGQRRPLTCPSQSRPLTSRQDGTPAAATAFVRGWYSCPILKRRGVSCLHSSASGDSVHQRAFPERLPRARRCRGLQYACPSKAPRHRPSGVLCSQCRGPAQRGEAPRLRRPSQEQRAGSLAAWFLPPLAAIAYSSPAPSRTPSRPALLALPRRSASGTKPHEALSLLPAAPPPTACAFLSLPARALHAGRRRQPGTGERRGLAFCQGIN